MLQEILFTRLGDEALNRDGRLCHRWYVRMIQRVERRGGCPLAPVPLPHRLEQHHPRRHRHVQAVHVAAHRDRDHQVAPLAHQATQPLPLRAEDDRRRQREIDRVVGLRAPRPRGRRSTRRAPSAPRSTARCSRRRRPARASARPPTPSPPRCRATPTGGSGGSRRAPPHASTDRTIAPTLCGSSMPSSTTRSGAPAGAPHEVRHAVVARGAHVRDHALVDGVPRERARARRPRRAGPARPAPRPAATISWSRGSFRAPTRIAVTRPAFKASRTGWMPWMRACHGQPSTAANAAARAAQEAIGATPVPFGSSAPRSIAGTARSSSGPSAAPVSATRIGWKSARALLARRVAHALRGGPEDLAGFERTGRRQLGGQRTHDRPRRLAGELRGNRRVGRRGRRVEREQEPQAFRRLRQAVDRGRQHRQQRLDVAQCRRRCAREDAGPLEVRHEHRREPRRLGELQVVPVHPRELVLVEHAGAVRRRPRGGTGARAPRPAAAPRRRPATSR